MDAPRPDVTVSASGARSGSCPRIGGEPGPRPGDEPSLVVAVDGPSGAGKSSVSRGVAVWLGLRYLDTGAMYRAVTLWMLENGVDVDDDRAVATYADKPTVVIGTNPGAPTVSLDSEDVTGSIRSRAVTAAVSPVSAVPEVRARLVELQRGIIARGAPGIVVEGRDIGTVVAPDAPVKVFLTASADVRAERRTAELTGGATVAATRDDLARRDRVDSTRGASPLVRAADAVVVDATDLPLDEVIDAVLGLVRERAGVSGLVR